MIRPGQVKVRSCHVMSSQYEVRSGKLASQDMAGQVRLGQTESGHDNVSNATL